VRGKQLALGGERDVVECEIRREHTAVPPNDSRHGLNRHDVKQLNALLSGAIDDGNPGLVANALRVEACKLAGLRRSGAIASWRETSRPIRWRILRGHSSVSDWIEQLQ